MSTQRNLSPNSVDLPVPVSSPEHPEYLNRVYAGVLGKIIGVYVGRPVENWTFERIEREIGEISYYIHEKLGRRLIITDDDISGMLTFLRAIEDYGYDPNLTAQQMGQTWLNYLIEETTILWWGGLGNSTEHTAYLRLKSGIPAPMSGSEITNSRTVAEQIGGQIFIDGWGLINPGEPERAADFARRAASVSHDGEGIYGAQVVAAMIAQAFVETDIQKLLDVALQQIPGNSTIQRLSEDLRKWHQASDDWRTNRALLEENYGYHKFKGHCHIIPNHGLIILSLLHGNGDFDESLKIINTCGWDTDCNSGNLGTILGVRNGLAGLNNQDWRGPVADRLYLPSADAGRSISDAATESIWVANAARQMRGMEPIDPGYGHRFHFKLPGSVQGWHALTDQGFVAHCICKEGYGALEITCNGQAESPFACSTPTFVPPDTKDMVTGYVLVACPTLYPGHLVKANLTGMSDATTGRIFLEHYGPEDGSIRINGPQITLVNGQETTLEWRIPENGGYPIHEIGIELNSGSVQLHWLDWSGVPKTSFPPTEGTMWARAWAQAVHRFQFARDRYEYLAQNTGLGFLIQGSRTWKDYRVECRLTPRMAVSSGIAVRVQGLQRYYAFLFGEQGEVRLDKVRDGHKVLAKVAFPWEPFRDYDVAVETQGQKLRLFIDGELILQATDGEAPLESGAFALVVEEGCIGTGTPSISPL
jgi:ADP-ribosylglycohydrolase